MLFFVFWCGRCFFYFRFGWCQCDRQAFGDNIYYSCCFWPLSIFFCWRSVPSKGRIHAALTTLKEIHDVIFVCTPSVLVILEPRGIRRQKIDMTSSSKLKKKKKDRFNSTPESGKHTEMFCLVATFITS